MSLANDSMPLRILHVVDALGQGGLENGVVNLIHQLDGTDFEHVVCAMRGLGPNAQRLPADRVRVLCLDASARRRLDVPALVRIIREVKPDVVHSRNWGTIEAVIAARLAGSYAAVHGEHGYEAGGAPREPLRRTWFRRLAYELADRVLTVSHQLRDFQARRTGFRADRITVIHNGVDGGRFCPDSVARVRVRQQWGVSENELCIGCVGNLWPVKDHMTLLRALEIAERSGRDWRVVLVGEGVERTKLETFIGAHPNWKGRVVLHGSSTRVPEILNGLDVYVLPSLNEGICNSLLEAMATGLPVIASAVGGNPEVVVDGESGMLFPAGDSQRLNELLLSLWRNPELRAELGLSARRRILAHFSLDAMAQEYRRMYLSLRRAPLNVGAAVRA